MATSTLASAVASDTTGTGSSITGPCTVMASGTFTGTKVTIEYSLDDSTYVPIHEFTETGAISVNGEGTYYLRAVTDVLTPGATPAVTIKANN